jgi:hypothetical protein
MFNRVAVRIRVKHDAPLSDGVVEVRTGRRRGDKQNFSASSAPSVGALARRISSGRIVIDGNP